MTHKYVLTIAWSAADVKHYRFHNLDTANATFEEVASGRYGMDAQWMDLHENLLAEAEDHPCLPRETLVCRWASREYLDHNGLVCGDVN